jgi:hypothetical protein
MIVLRLAILAVLIFIVQREADPRRGIIEQLIVSSLVWAFSAALVVVVRRPSGMS